MLTHGYDRHPAIEHEDRDENDDNGETPQWELPPDIDHSFFRRPRRDFDQSVVRHDNSSQTDSPDTRDASTETKTVRFQDDGTNESETVTETEEEATETIPICLSVLHTVDLSGSGTIDNCSADWLSVPLA